MKFVLLATVSIGVLSASITPYLDSTKSPKPFMDVVKIGPNNTLTSIMNRIQNSMAEAFDQGVSPERWHLAKSELYALEIASKSFQPNVSANEYWQFQHKIWVMRHYLFPSKDAQVAQACENGQQDKYCVYYTFPAYVIEVKQFDKACKELRNMFHASRSFKNRGISGLFCQISEIKTMLDNLRVAPLDRWGTEPGFEDTQRQMKLSSFIFDEISSFVYQEQKQKQGQGI
ncbi:hypothetical protein OXX59_004408 [Metschnikowia pulcherrima]